MDLAERSRLEKLLGMLGSSFDGERANAARMIAAMAERKKVTIAEMVLGVERAPISPRRARRAERRKVANTLLSTLAEIAADTDAYEFVLTEWECQFATDVSARYESDYDLSGKQLAIVEKIIEKVEAARTSKAGS